MRKALKIIGIIIGSVLLLLLGAVVYLNTQPGQNFVRGKAEAFLQQKLKTVVHIGHLGYGLPKYVVLNDVLLLDQAKDTLLAAGELKIDIAMLKLLHKEVDVQELTFKGVHAHIYRNRPDTAYNFSYIINAFAGNKPKDANKPKDTSSMRIDLDRVKLDDIHVRFDDYTGGTRFAADLDHLDLKMKELNMDQMLFHVQDLAINGLQTSFSQDTSYLPLKTKDTAKTKLTLVADNMSVQQLGFTYNDALNKLLFSLKLGDMQLQLNKFGLADNTIDIKKLVLNNTDVSLAMGAASKAPAFVDTLIKIDTTEGWHITANDMKLAGINFKMDNNGKQHIPFGMDYSHLFFRQAALGVHNFLYTSDTISGDVKHFAGTEQCGLNVQELRTTFNYNPQGATLNDLYLQTPYTTLQDHIEVHYPSLDSLQKNTQALQLNLNVKNSIVGTQDILLFAPQLKDIDIFRKISKERVKLTSVITGSLGNMNIAYLSTSGLSNTEMIVNGRLSGLPNAADLSYNLHVTRFVSSRRDVARFVPDSLLSSVRLPDKFGVMGQLAGTEKDYNADMVLVTTDGRAYIKGLVHTSPGKNKEQYDLFVKTDQLNIGRILKQDSLLGVVSANIKLKGTGFDVKTMAAAVDAEITAAEIKGYHYHDLVMHGKVAAKAGNVTFTSADSNFRVKLKATADFTGQYAAAVADINIDSIDLRALKLYSSELRIRGIMHLDLPELNPDYPRGTFMWRQPVVTTNGKRYYLDSMYVISRPSKDTGQNILVDLDVLQATITGKTPLTKIAAIVQDHINRHYAFIKDSAGHKQDSLHTIAGTTKPRDTTTIPADYNLALEAHVLDRPLLHSLLPGLTSIDSIHVDGSLSPHNLAMNVTIPNLVYSSSVLQNGVIQLRGADSAFTYKVTADRLSYSDYSLWYAVIHGNLDRNTITANISLSDSTQKEQFALVADLQQAGDTQIVHLQKGLKLNYDAWDVAEPNRIAFSNGGFYVSNFSISNKGQYIKANSEQQRINTPLKVDLANFQLSNITGVMSRNDSLLVAGALNGSVTLQHLTPDMALTSDLSVKGLSVLGDTLGDLQLNVATTATNTLDTKLKLTGQGNDIALNGQYYLKTNGGNDFNFDLLVTALAVRSFETIAQNQLNHSKGYVRGDLKLQGTTSAPQITGELHTDSLVTIVTQLNALFKMPSEKMTFANNKVSFSDFTIHDSADNKAVFTGDVDITDFSNIGLDMHINATNWRAVHSKPKDNKMFYGDLLLTTKLDIKGTPSAPGVDGTLKILKGTDFTVVTPENNPELQSAKGIVAFVNMKDTGRRNVLLPVKKDTVHRRKLAVGSDINVNVTVDKTAQFTLIIDQASGDFLKVRGDASLNAAVTPGGVLTLTGNYDLHDGAYQLNYNFIKRKFLIKEGSSITFAGDPVKGTSLDVTAVYEANVPPYDLVQRQVPDPAQLNYYKQNLPFDVDLHLKGQVLLPAITFDVVLPDNKVYPLSSDQIELIQGKLNQVRTDTSELNKQVFAVLILNRFVSDDPFSSAASPGVGFTALQSVSTFIGEQLNQAAGKLIKGIDISADLQTTQDYTTGDMRQRTDLNLAASKTLLNDRLKLTIGNDFELEGPQTTNSDQSSLVPSNLAADYLLSADGKYTVRAYRKNYDEGVLEGYVTETGLNFIVSLDYNNFKNAFKKKKPEQSKPAAK